MKKVALILLSSLYFLQVYSQKQANTKEIYLSVSAGYSLFGPREDINSQMSTSGFNDKSPKWVGIGGNQYGGNPHPVSSNNSLGYDIAATYYLNNGLGININYGLVNNITVLGFDDVGMGWLGNFLFLESKIRSTSLICVFRSSDRLLNLSIGPALIIHNVRDVSGGDNSPETKNIKMGINTSYLVNVVKPKQIIFAIKLNHRWAPKSKIGPFVSESIGFPDHEPITSVFPATKVGLGIINIGLVFGVRLFKF